MFTLELETENDEEGYYGRIFHDTSYGIKLITRLTRNGDLDGFVFSWKVGESQERELEWGPDGPIFMDIKYVFNNERCINNPLLGDPPYDWLIEALQKASSEKYVG